MLQLLRFQKAVEWNIGAGANPEKAALVDHILNFLVYSIAINAILDLLALSMVVALSFFVTIGSAGTLICSIVTEDVAKGFISGLALTLLNKDFILGKGL
jgi:small-conductance mechanosensitive channel